MNKAENQQTENYVCKKCNTLLELWYSQYQFTSYNFNQILLTESTIYSCTQCKQKYIKINKSEIMEKLE